MQSRPDTTPKALISSLRLHGRRPCLPPRLKQQQQRNSLMEELRIQWTPSKLKPRRNLAVSLPSYRESFALEHPSSGRLLTFRDCTVRKPRANQSNLRQKLLRPKTMPKLTSTSKTKSNMLNDNTLNAMQLLPDVVSSASDVCPKRYCPKAVGLECSVGMPVRECL